jgi:hypothetical protein
MLRQDIYDAAEGYRSAEPGLLVNRLVTHFRQLFGVRSMEGMFPKMNEVYLFVNEMENFLRMVRAVLGKKSNMECVKHGVGCKTWSQV